MDSINPHIALEYWHGQRKLNEKLRQQSNPYHMKESDFRSYFRFTPVLAIKLIEELEPLQRTQETAGTATDDPQEKFIPFDTKCLVAFNFYATGSYQNQIKSIGHMSQPAISKCIGEVTDLLNILMSKYIKFPQEEAERDRIAGEFAKKGIPGIIGIIDGTQIALSGVPKEVEMVYVNRKGFHSINVQIVVNDRNIITHINARYPGSVHDSFVWKASQLYAMFENEYTTPDAQKYWLLGDQGYPLMPFLITVSEEGITAKEKEFYCRHKIIRSQVERAIGILKNRFRCILSERKLHYAPKQSAKIINAVAVCHNFLMLHGYEDEYVTAEHEIPINTEHEHRYSGNNPYLQAGRQVRQRIIDNLLL